MSTTSEETSSRQLTRHFIAGLLSSEEIHSVQFLCVIIAAVEEGSLRLLMFGERLGGLWLLRFFCLFCCGWRWHVVYGGPFSSLAEAGLAIVRRALRVS
jgi:hypothetical protein